MSIGNKTRQIGELHDKGWSISGLANKFGITERSVEKRIASYQRSLAESNPNMQVLNKQWTFENVKKGFEDFYLQYGRFPTAYEIDEFDKLPSSRHIQREFGGLIKLRKRLGYTITNFSAGENRSRTAKRINDLGIQAEILLEKELVSRFGELCVHTQKRFDGSKGRFDFVIYADNDSFGVDVFNTGSASNIGNNVTHKLKKYAEHASNKTLYIVISGDSIEQTDIDRRIKNLSLFKNMANVKVVTLHNFLLEMENYSRLMSIDKFKPFI